MTRAETLSDVVPACYELSEVNTLLDLPANNDVAGRISKGYSLRSTQLW